MNTKVLPVTNESQAVRAKFQHCVGHGCHIHQVVRLARDMTNALKAANRSSAKELQDLKTAYNNGESRE